MAIEPPTHVVKIDRPIVRRGPESRLKGEVAVIRLYKALTLLPGCWAISRTASIVSVGALPPLGVASENSALHSPVLPLEFTHVARRSASVFSSRVGECSRGQERSGRRPVRCIHQIVDGGESDD